MTHSTLTLPPEIMDALHHPGGRTDAEIQKIICKAPRHDYHRRARMARSRA